MVRILETTFKGKLYHVATPLFYKLRDREFDLTNSSQECGRIMCTSTTVPVGRSENPHRRSRGQKFVVGFGGARYRRARCELADRGPGRQPRVDPQVPAGDREFQERGRAHPDLRTAAAYSDGRDIRIKLGQLKDPLSTEPGSTCGRSGPRTFSVGAVSGAGRTHRLRVIEYSYTLDFDRNFSLGLVGEAAAAVRTRAATSGCHVNQRANGSPLVALPAPAMGKPSLDYERLQRG